MRKVIAPSIMCVFLFGCTKNVTLVVKNQLPGATAPPLNVTAIAKDKNGLQTGTTGLGTVNPGQQSGSQTFPVKRGGTYQVRADLASGVTAFMNGTKTVSSDLPNEEVDITQIVGAGVLDPNDISAITSTFGKLGANVGFNPVTVPSALNSLFGGLVWFIDGGAQDVAESQLVIVVPPAQLTGAVSLADFQYPTGNNVSHNDVISTDASVKASGTIPLWGNLSGSFATNSIYKTHWTLTGFGNVTKNDSVSFQDKLSALSDAQKTDICNRLKTPKSHVMYVNEMYVVKSAVLTYEKGLTIASGASLEAGSVIAGNAAYNFSNVGQESTEIEDTVVNVEGPTFAADTMAICHQNPVNANGAQQQIVQPRVIHPAVLDVLGIGGAGLQFKDLSGNIINLSQAAVKHTTIKP